MRLRALLFPLLVAASTASLAQAQAPRGSAETKVGPATVTVEWGAPPWNAGRATQLEQMVPVGAAWRLGADWRTTIKVADGDLLFGGVLVPSGWYGLNLRHVAAKEWAFCVYEGVEANVGVDDAEWQVPATVELDGAKQYVERLAIAVEELEPGRRRLVVRFGPHVVSAPLAAAQRLEREVAIGDDRPTVRTWSYAAADVAPGAWIRVASVGSFWVGDEDCAFDVDLRLDGEAAQLRATPRELSKVAARARKLQGARGEEAAAALAEAKEELARLEKWNPFGGATPVALAPAAKDAGRIGAGELASDGGKLRAALLAGKLAGELDLARFLPKAPAAK